MQANLFEHATDPSQYTDHDLGDAVIREYPLVFSIAESDDYLQQLQESIDWRQDSLWIAGRKVAVPRLQCWMGDHDSRYGYSGMRLLPSPWNNSVLAIRDRIERLGGSKFNSVLLNYYRSGQDSVAWHADDEPELGPAPIIASVSFGAERRFQLKHKHQESPARFQLMLRNGSVLIMGNTLQNNWMHQLPKIKGLESPRINLTFRTII
jgi:alkylated DNA repair dioxygenase AlkB